MAKILIVDDDIISLMYIEKLLKSMGHTVVGKATSGPESVEEVEKHKPDIVFMDIAMPGKFDGIEAGKIIEKKMDIPIIFMTAYEIDLFEQRVAEVAPFGYIMKPFKELEIKAAIYIALYRRQMENRLNRAIENYKDLFYHQMLISEFLVELNKANDIYDKIDELLEMIRSTVGLNSIIIYNFNEEKKCFVNIGETIDEAYSSIVSPDTIILDDLFVSDKFGFEHLKHINFTDDFSIFSDNINQFINSAGVKSLISFPLFVEEIFYGIMVVGNIEKKSSGKNILKQLRSISIALSLLFKRHFDFVKIQQIEREKMIHEKINLRKERLVTIGQLSSAITHEINQPLQSIKLLSDSILFWKKEGQDIPEEKFMENFEKISHRVTRIDKIISNLKLLIKSPSSIEIRELDLNSVIDNINDLISAKMKSNGIKFFLNLGKDIGRLHVSEILFQQVITDITDNAINALKRVQSPDKMVMLSTRLEDNEVIVEITDNGPGIPDEEKQKIFEPFYSKNSTKDNMGMGLGLYLVYNFLKSFGGKIEVKDNEFGGATFLIIFNK